MKSIHEQDPLQNQYNALQIEWDSIKQSTSRSNRRNSTITPATAELFQIHDSSPKELMSSLQNENSPSEDHHHLLDPGNRDQVAIEIINQRKADFDSFPIRGRRLFVESQGESLDISQESEVSTECSENGSETGHEKQNESSVVDTPAAERDVTVKGGRERGGGFVGRWMICLAVMLFALSIVVFKCSGKDEQILVPT